MSTNEGPRAEVNDRDSEPARGSDTDDSAPGAEHMALRVDGRAPNADTQSEVVAQLEAMMAACHSDVEIPPADPRVWPKYREHNARLDALLGWPPAPEP